MNKKWISFNPLHCGAVVASGYRPRRPRRRGPVSIPFIAGQWSLRRARRTTWKSSFLFQSPSLRGSGRFAVWWAWQEASERVSIPFIAGQWSLQAAARARRDAERFQSPSLRGSGRFAPSAAAASRRRPSFNPLHCGAVVASLGIRLCVLKLLCFNPLHCGAVVASRSRHGRRMAGVVRVSIPFIAGQWSLPADRLAAV